MVKYLINCNKTKLIVTTLASLFAITFAFVLANNIILNEEAETAYNKLNPFLKILVNIVIPLKQNYYYVFLYIAPYIILINSIYTITLVKNLKNKEPFQLSSTKTSLLKTKRKALALLLLIPTLSEYLTAELVTTLVYKEYHFLNLLFYTVIYLLTYLFASITLEAKMLKKNS